MIFGNIVTLIAIVTGFRRVAGFIPKFRVLAPEFLCPSDENDVFEKPDNTIITVKTDASDLQVSWTVRWTHLENPSQRLVLLLWKTVRELQNKLNEPQAEPLVYVIDNAELLQGVEYIFNITALDPGSENPESSTKTFHIDNIKGDPKLMIEGRSDKFSVLLIGGETVYIDMEYVIQAEVTTCSPIQDYYFVWSVQSSTGSLLNVSNTHGSRLEIQPYSLEAGNTYYVRCYVYRNSSVFVAQNGLPFQVMYRGLRVNLNFDALVVSENNAFDVKATVDNHDYYGEVVQFEWKCVYEYNPCGNVESIDSDIFSFSNGLSDIGRYEITVTVTINDQQASSNASIIIVGSSLPVIQVQPQSRVLNENSVLTLVANASNVTPSCVLTWYFSDEDYLESFISKNDTCDTNSCQHGTPLSDSVTIFSLEENFLNELTDFTNETEWRQVIAEMKASQGRARFVAQCGCSLTFSCNNQGTVYADVNFVINKSPKVTKMKVSPETGIAMETVFRLSTLAASDPDKPLRYTFYCSLGDNDSLIVGSNLDNLAVETFLPYAVSHAARITGTYIWVEVCDSLGACSTSDATSVQLSAGEGRTLQVFVDTMRGHVDRCEVMMLGIVVKTAVATYKNAHKEELLSKFTTAVLETFPTSEEHHCISDDPQHHALLDWLSLAGVDLSSLNE